MEARLAKAAQLPENRREEMCNSLPPFSDNIKMSDVSETEPVAAAIMLESDAMFAKRLDGLETASRQYFEDASEVFKQVKDLPGSGQIAAGQAIVLKGMAKSLWAFQPWMEQGFAQLLRDNRALRRIAKGKVDR